MNDFKSYSDYCNGFGSDNEEEKTRSLLLLCVRDGLLKVVEFDKLSGEALPLGIVDVAQKASKCKFTVSDNDALTHIVKDFQDAFKHISNNMHEKIIRENIIMPVSKVREINTTGINWLSKKPGETIRQKLSNGYKMMAANRRLSFDTGENRLFLALLREFELFLTSKLQCLPSEKISKNEGEFYQDITKVLRNEDLNEIRRWENLAPNNTLLSDKYYRNAWNAWLSLHKLDDIIANDNRNISQRLMSVFLLRFIFEISKYCRLPPLPVIF
jgi:hypothetical protein